MLERQKHIDKIIEKLSMLKTQVELSNSLNLTDTNVVSENFYRDFLNLLYGYNLQNINAIVPNATAIDLGDEERSITIQVTSTADLSKIKKTVESFVGKELNKKYDRLVVLIITSKKQYKTASVDYGDYQLSTSEDVWDISKILSDINGLSLERVKEICEFLEQQILYSPDQTLAKEIHTFISLISVLSDESHPSAGNGFIDAPDPDGKINERFAAHADFLTNEYQDLYAEYGQVLSDVLEQADIGHTRIRRLGLHLKTSSDDVLNQNNGDATEALKALVASYKGLLSENGTEYDENAIRFFLVDQLIRCNVFPNKEAVNV
ncbi:MAG: SMEK domain-containing protein [Rickettsiales bacterium]